MIYRQIDRKIDQYRQINGKTYKDRLRQMQNNIARCRDRQMDL